MKYSHIASDEEFKEFMEEADKADYWDAMEPEEWSSACEYVGLDYRAYDDPDALWRDLEAKLEQIEKGCCE